MAVQEFAQGTHILSTQQQSHMVVLCMAFELSYRVYAGAACGSTCMHSHRQLMLSSAYSWTAPQPSSRLHSSPDPETTQTHAEIYGRCAERSN